MNLRSRTRLSRYRLTEMLHENSWLIPAIGAACGALLALILTNIEPKPSPASIGVTVDRERDSLLATLGLLFTGLSIVLSLGAVSAQNIASKFSMRLVGAFTRSFAHKTVIGVFALAASYILLVQVQLRSEKPTDPARPLALIVALLLLVLSGISIIYYVGWMLRGFRVERTVQQVAKTTCRTAYVVDHLGSQDLAVPLSALGERPGSGPIIAPKSGYIVSVDIDALNNFAIKTGCVVCINAEIGQAVVEGEVIGWAAAFNKNGDGSASPVTVNDQAILIESSRNLGTDTAFGIRILVDIALIALSPGINDPYTAVQCIDQLSIVLTDLSKRRLGPTGRKGSDGQFRVLVRSATLTDLFDLATRQIIIYGSGDPTVRAALVHFVNQVERTSRTDEIGNAVSALREELQLAK